MVGAINSFDGRFIFSALKKQYFKWNHFLAFIKRIKSYYEKENLCLFIDNAKIHTKKEFVDEARSMGIRIVYNLPYHPNLMGIEKVWGIKKSMFRKQLDELKIKKERFNVWDMFKSIKLKNLVIKSIAKHGWKSIFRNKLNSRDDIKSF